MRRPFFFVQAQIFTKTDPAYSVLVLDRPDFQKSDLDLVLMRVSVWAKAADQNSAPAPSAMPDREPTYRWGQILSAAATCEKDRASD